MLAASSARKFFFETSFADPSATFSEHPFSLAASSATDFLSSFALADPSASQLSPPFPFADPSARGFVCQSECEVSK